jgi:hypothetical protein
LVKQTSLYNQRGTAEQWIEEGKNAVKWTRLKTMETTEAVSSDGMEKRV